MADEYLSDGFSDEYDDDGSPVARARRPRKAGRKAPRKRPDGGVKGQRLYTPQKEAALRSMRKAGQNERVGRASDANASKTVGDKNEVYFGVAKRTSGGLRSGDLVLVAETGRVVSRAKREAGKRMYKRMSKDPDFKAKWQSNKF